ncbi:HNH endonuclease [Clostridium perfringens]|uniref:HNH endonuclease signature motif containing protein n=1 Tax=Clostridium perfringens TaxID=1502 RepID=UPI0022474643|nr:HNH endonuclease signature motif containing protein [Clostridium perfringens]MCX0386683.1 HNH endonuclease [Clostridium perfringens]
MFEENWDKCEIEKLIKMYPYLSNKDLSIIFNRSISSIQHKASRLKLKKDTDVKRLIWSRVRSGEKSSAWKGGRKLNKKGHVLILRKGHPLADKNGYVLEHRFIMCEYLGRILRPDEVVHHKNKIKTDNRIENLEIMTNSEHTRLHNIGRKVSVETRNKISKSKKNKEI